MAFLKETSRTIKIFLIFFSSIFLLELIYQRSQSPDLFAGVFYLLMLYCGIKFEYIIKNAPKFLIGIIILAFVRSLILYLIDFNLKDFFSFIISTAFYAYLTINIYRLSKENKQEIKK